MGQPEASARANIAHPVQSHSQPSHTLLPHAPSNGCTVSHICSALTDDCAWLSFA